MRTERFRRWMGLLEARLDPGERILARGRAFELHADLGLDLDLGGGGPGVAVAVTEQRVLWAGRADRRWVRELRFDRTRSYTEVTRAHRYALALDHDGLDRLVWAPAHRFLVWSWGNAEVVRPMTTTVLAFSRPDTEAVLAVRSRLEAAGVRANGPRRLPRPRRTDTGRRTLVRALPGREGPLRGRGAGWRAGKRN